MIKKLSFKFVLVFLVLVVSVIITSSCYAFLTTKNISVLTLEDFDLTMDDINQKIIDNGYEEYLNYRKIFITNSNGSSISIFIINDSTNDISYLKENSSSASDNVVINFLNNSNNILSRNVLSMSYNPSTKYWVGPSLQGIGANFRVYYNPYFLSITEYDLKDSSGNLIFSGYEPVPNQCVNVTHEFQSDTSAKVSFDYGSYGTEYILKYSLTGVDIGSSLTETLQLRNPVIYTPGVSNLVVSSNTKVYWALYDLNGACVESNVYQVPEYDVVIENADKDIEYEVTYSEDYTYAVISATLKNGVFSDKLVYSEFSSLNISTGKLDYGYQNFSGSLKITENGKYYFYAIDTFGNVFDTALIEITDIFNFKDTDFSYSIKNDSTLHGGYKLNITPVVKNWSSKVDIMYNIELTSGHQLATVTVDTEYPDSSYVDSIVGNYGLDNSVGAPIYFNGRIMSGDTIRIFSPSNNLEDLKGNITFKIYKKSDNSLIFDKTYTLSISAFTTGNIAGGNSGGVSGSLPSDSENSGDFSYNDYGDVSWSDVEDYIGTSGSFWSIIKNILNNLPKWITAPIFFFISAVVAIALIKAILH